MDRLPPRMDRTFPTIGVRVLLVSGCRLEQLGSMLISIEDVTDRRQAESVLASADVLPLLSQVDGVVIVTRVGSSTRDSAERMLKELRRVPGINIIGVVANGIPRRIYRTRAYGYYYG